MSAQATWSDAAGAALDLDHNSSDRRTLLLLSRLPLIPVKPLQQITGLRDGASLYRQLNRLKHAGLIRGLRLPAERRRLLHLTDLGIAALGLDQGFDPVDWARRNRLRGRDLLAELLGLPRLLALYDLIGALAAAGPSRPELLAWERPWRRRFERFRTRTPLSVRIPAYAAIGSGDETESFLLLPDPGPGMPLHLYRRPIGDLLAARRLDPEAIPTLVVATSDASRAGAWRDLLKEVARGQVDQVLASVVLTRDEVRAGGCERLRNTLTTDRSSSELVRRVTVRKLEGKQSGRLPQLVNDELATPPQTEHERLGRLSLALSAQDRQLVDLISRHPFLPIENIARWFEWDIAWAEQRLQRLVALGLARRVESDEITKVQPPPELAEATRDGLRIVSAEYGFPVWAAIQELGLVGGGPKDSAGKRAGLLANLAHTLGADQTFIALREQLEALARDGWDGALLEWRSAAACRRHLCRPDAYGMIRYRGQQLGFFLEYDRGTMSRHDLESKIRTYYKYRQDRGWERDYLGMPIVLFVTEAYESAAEKRIADAARTWLPTNEHRPPLDLLITSTNRIHRPDNWRGFFGPIWWDGLSDFEDRRPWPPSKPAKEMESLAGRRP